MDVKEPSPDAWCYRWVKDLVLHYWSPHSRGGWGQFFNSYHVSSSTPQNNMPPQCPFILSKVSEVCKVKPLCESEELPALKMWYCSIHQYGYTVHCACCRRSHCQWSILFDPQCESLCCGFCIKTMLMHDSPPLLVYNLDLTNVVLPVAKADVFYVCPVKRVRR